MIKFIYIFIILLILGFVSSPSRADDGRDFFMVQTARLGEAGIFTGIFRQDFFSELEGDAFEFEPLLSWNAYNWLSLEVNVDSEKTPDESFKTEAIVSGLRLRITPEKDPLMLGIATRYKFAVDSNIENAFNFTMLLSYQIKKWLMGANLGIEKTRGLNREADYSIGIKRELSHHFSLAFEVARSLEANNKGEVVMGVFYEFNDAFQVNVGIGRGINSNVDFTLKTAIVFAF